MRLHCMCATGCCCCAGCMRRCCVLQELCLALQQKWQVTHVAMAHRTGTVKVCEASVIIAVSSPHRQAALQVRAGADV